MALAKFVSLELLSVPETRFRLVLVMLKWLKLIKQGLQSLVISDCLPFEKMIFEGHLM